METLRTRTQRNTHTHTHKNHICCAPLLYGHTCGRACTNADIKARFLISVWVVPLGDLWVLPPSGNLTNSVTHLTFISSNCFHAQVVHHMPTLTVRYANINTQLCTLMLRRGFLPWSYINSLNSDRHTAGMFSRQWRVNLMKRCNSCSWFLLQIQANCSTAHKTSSATTTL